MRLFLNHLSPIIFVVTSLFSSHFLHAEDNWEFDADIGIESRFFFDDPRLAGQSSNDQFSLLTNLEWRWQSDNDNHRVTIIPFARIDSVDSERSHIDLREAYWAYEGNGWDLLIGLNKVFWGVNESRHLVDIINQTDAVEDLDQEDKLGQPMINLSLQKNWGKLDFFLLPYFRERTFSGEDGRLREPLVVDESQAQFESADEEEHLDWAVRYSHYFGDVDIGLSYFDGTSREPTLIPDISRDRFIPFYEQIEQIGLDVQYTTDAWLWKLEAIHRDTQENSFAAAVAGFEYTRYQVFQSNADLGLLVEYLYDDREANDPPTLFDDDVFLGTRLAFNDAQDSSILAGIIYDPETEERFYNVEAERRFGQSLTAELRLRIFSGDDKSDPFNATGSDDYLQLRLTKFF